MFVVVSGIAPAKRDLVIGERDESVVGDGDAMGVVAQITERMLGASEGPFGVDVPVVSEQGSDPGGEDFGVSEGFQVAMEAQLALPEVAFESGHKLTAKDATEHLDGKEEGVAWLDPVGAIERQSAGGHDAMHVRVVFEFLIPGVEHTEEADLGAEMFGIASDCEERCGTGLQQKMVQEFLVLQSERRQFMR